MAKDIKYLASDVMKHAAALKKVADSTPRIMAQAALKMKDANFSAQGFIENGSVIQPWPKRKSETERSNGKAILHSTGNMQDSVKATVKGNTVTVGVDTNKVPYAQIHNEGGKTAPHTIKARGKKALKFSTSKGHVFRKEVKHPGSNIPQRKYLGYSTDIEKITERELTAKIKAVFK